MKLLTTRLILQNTIKIILKKNPFKSKRTTPLFLQMLIPMKDPTPTTLKMQITMLAGERTIAAK
jgi:hypothetical protein